MVWSLLRQVGSRIGNKAMYIHRNETTQTRGNRDQYYGYSVASLRSNPFICGAVCHLEACIHSRVAVSLICAVFVLLQLCVALSKEICPFCFETAKAMISR